jgi:hypothetical protein
MELPSAVQAVILAPDPIIILNDEEAQDDGQAKEQDDVTAARVDECSQTHE